ncbi:hypothetical protein EZS27_024553, partial [termite gut metagenome]
WEIFRVWKVPRIILWELPQNPINCIGEGQKESPENSDFQDFAAFYFDLLRSGRDMNI